MKRIVVTLVLAGLAGCSDGNGEADGCVVDTDCPGTQVCLDGACTDYDPCRDKECDPEEECVNGQCLPLSCSGTSCTLPPGHPGCYDLPAPCVNGVCDYQPVADRACDDADACTTGDGCRPEGACLGLPLVCDQPPASTCKDVQTLLAYPAHGTCQAGACQYVAVEVACPEGCEQGACVGDPCEGVTCDQPPASECLGANLVRNYATVGTCQNGLCNYDFDDTYCPHGCQEGACAGDPCAGIVCDDPPPDSCVDAQTLRQYAPAGSCTSGVCDYPFSLVPCEHGCDQGLCQGCTPAWQDTSACACVPTECEACQGTKQQEDGCGNTREVGCTLPASGCPDGQSCQNGQCVGCSGCRSGEVCIDDRCAPVAIVLARPSLDTTAFWCPPGYVPVGRWQTGPGVFDAASEGVDFHGFKITAGWMWVCSADPAGVHVIIDGDDCGSGTSTCPGSLRGSWHVGSGCAGGIHGVDHHGNTIQAGWMRLCVEPGVEAKVETAHNDCGAAGPGCGGLKRVGNWHTDPAQCGSGDTGVGDGGVAIETGWMMMCVDTDSYPPVDASTLAGKVMAGYQGWFGAPGDGSVRNAWVHWFRSQTPAPENATFDLWPDLSELDADELFATAMSYPGGQNASLYSAYHPKTVMRHFEWMADYGIDGAFLQRFVCEIGGGGGLEFRDQVTRNVVAGAEATGRVFVIMWDISGAPEATFVDTLIDDWKHLVDDPSLAVTSSDRYLHHEGRPLVAIWGPGFTDRPGSPADAQALIDFFRNAPEQKYRATVMGGVPTNWRTGTGDSQPGYDAVYRAYDVISPWSVGRYGDEAGVVSFNANYIQPDLAEAGGLGRDYLPVVWPGFSWANLWEDPGLFNAIPRHGGSFFFRQLFEAQNSGCDMLYVAMFDEVDESTAIFKAAATQGDLPTTGLFLALDQDGTAVPSDWYLRLAGAGNKMLKGQVVLDPALPLQ